MSRSIVLIAHNLRSSHNVGSLLRTADGLGCKLYLTGYTPYPLQTHDSRLPHLAAKTAQQIHKTALGAENSVPWQQADDISEVLQELRHKHYIITALEQAPQAISLPEWQPPDRIALIVGREVEGLEPDLIQAVDQVVEIPMQGQKESFNVTIAAAMALYHARFFS